MTTRKWRRRVLELIWPDDDQIDDTRASVPMSHDDLQRTFRLLTGLTVEGSTDRMLRAHILRHLEYDDNVVYGRDQFTESQLVDLVNALETMELYDEH